MKILLPIRFLVLFIIDTFLSPDFLSGHLVGNNAIHTTEFADIKIEQTSTI